MKIVEAIYKKDNIVEQILADSLTKEIYYKKYREYLFCPKPDCNAMLSFVILKKNDLGYFRTWSKKKHKEGCPFEVVYDDDFNIGKGKSSGEELYNVSDNHVIEKLKRVFEEMMKDKSTTNISRQKAKAIKKNINMNSIEASAEATFNKGTDINDGREPYILTRMYDKLDQSDFEKTRCVIGYVYNMYILENHAFINITPKTNNSVKIKFNNFFIENNLTQYKKFNFVKDYIDSLKKQGKELICCCIGKVKKVPNGINIHPYKYNGFTLNGLHFYEIINQFIK